MLKLIIIGHLMLVVQCFLSEHFYLWVCKSSNKNFSGEVRNYSTIPLTATGSVHHQQNWACTLHFSLLFTILTPKLNLFVNTILMEEGTLVFFPEQNCLPWRLAYLRHCNLMAQVLLWVMWLLFWFPWKMFLTARMWISVKETKVIEGIWNVRGFRFEYW